QGAAIWRYNDTGSAHFSVSNRTRFPTVFERFSSRFGGALSNPWLKPERALNIELGVKDRIAPGVVGSAAIFSSRVNDAIQTVNISYTNPGTGATGTYGQSQNVGTARFSGIELGVTAVPSDQLEVGASYSYVHTKVHNPNDPHAHIPTPLHRGFIYAKWQAIPKLTIIPALELSDNRLTSSSTASGYVKTGAYELLSLKLEYKLMPQWDISVAARNLLDKNYALSDGYPQEGRNFLVSTRYKF
ncbi:MAG: TonB-dependent receptor, partial [Azoarcus sp.]|nr:TonB-dependent receptor [Azoarcus sp.]